MAARIEDYGLIGDLQTAALVSRDGRSTGSASRASTGARASRRSSAPRRTARAIGPASGSRRPPTYRGDSLVLESELECAEGVIRLVDFMPPRGKAPDVIRIVEGVSGRVPVRADISIRFDYGSVIPWVRRREEGTLAVAGPDALLLTSPVELVGENMHTVAEFEVAPGDRVPFVLTWYPSNEDLPEHVDAEQALNDTEAFWEDWTGGCRHEGPHRDALVRSLVTLKALTYAPTGGIVAAPTTSLPEASAASATGTTASAG